MRLLLHLGSEPGAAKPEAAAWNWGHGERTPELWDPGRGRGVRPEASADAAAAASARDGASSDHDATTTATTAAATITAAAFNTTTTAYATATFNTATTAYAAATFNTASFNTTATAYAATAYTTVYTTVYTTTTTAIATNTTAAYTFPRQPEPAQRRRGGPVDRNQARGDAEGREDDVREARGRLQRPRSHRVWCSRRRLELVSLRGGIRGHQHGGRVQASLRGYQQPRRARFQGSDRGGCAKQRAVSIRRPFPEPAGPSCPAAAASVQPAATVAGAHVTATAINDKPFSNHRVTTTTAAAIAVGTAAAINDKPSSKHRVTANDTIVANAVVTAIN